MNTGPNHFDVVIATPGRSMVSDYVCSLAQTIDYFNRNNISYCYLNEYSSHVAAARYKTWQSFYEKHGSYATYKKFIWIDSDISWDVEQIMNLYNHEEDMVSGSYIIFKDNVAAHKNPTHIFSIEEIKQLKQCEEIMYCGMGFVAIDFGIIEKLEDPFMPIKFEYGGLEYWEFGEDLSFFIRAKLFLNKKVWIDPSIKVNHHKMDTWKWD